MDAYLQRLQGAIASAVHGMTAEVMRHHPEGKWSTAEVLEHLYLTYTGTAKAFERCLHEGKPLARTPVLKDRVRAHLWSPDSGTCPRDEKRRSMPYLVGWRLKKSYAKSGRGSQPWTT